MIDDPVVTELQEVRRRLAEQCQYDIKRYAEMLKEVSKEFPGTYITAPRLPLMPRIDGSSDESVENPEAVGDVA
jgi:hypothetical protein